MSTFNSKVKFYLSAHGPTAYITAFDGWQPYSLFSMPRAKLRAAIPCNQLIGAASERCSARSSDGFYGVRINITLAQTVGCYAMGQLRLHPDQGLFLNDEVSPVEKKLALSLFDSHIVAEVAENGTAPIIITPYRPIKGCGCYSCATYSDCHRMWPLSFSYERLHLVRDNEDQQDKYWLRRILNGSDLEAPLKDLAFWNTVFGWKFPAASRCGFTLPSDFCYRVVFKPGDLLDCEVYMTRSGFCLFRRPRVTVGGEYLSSDRLHYTIFNNMVPKWLTLRVPYQPKKFTVELKSV